MRQTLIPFGGYAFEKREEFPPSGKEGMLYLADDESKIYVFRNGEYKVYGGSASAGGTHNDLSGINGGEHAGDAVIYAGHLTQDELNDVRGIRKPVPLRPENVIPTVGETGIMPSQQFTGTAFVSFMGLSMRSMRLEVSTSIDFKPEDIVFDGIHGTDTTVFVMPKNTDGEYYLHVNTTYYWRIRYQDENNTWSDPSNPTDFVTAEVFPPTVAYAPELIVPIEGQAVPFHSAVLVGSPPHLEGEPATHNSTDWEIRPTRDPEASGTVYISEGDTANLTALSVPVDLSESITSGQLYARIRYHLTGQTSGEAVDTPWSLPRMFRRKGYHTDYVIGIEVAPAPNGGLTINHINDTGDRVELPGDYFTKRNPLWTSLDADVTDERGNIFAMVLPAHYRFEKDEETGVRRYWLSPYEFDGSDLHPMSKNTSGLLYGKFFTPTNDDTTGLSSKPGATAANATTEADWSVRQAAVKTSWGNDYSICPHYAKALINLLALFESKTFNLISVFGGEFNFTSGVLPNNSPFMSNFHGIICNWMQKNSDPWTNKRNECLTGGVVNGGRQLYLPESGNPLGSKVTISEVGWGTWGASVGAAAKDILSGHTNDIGFPLDLLFIPTDNSGGEKNFGPYSTWGIISTYPADVTLTIKPLAPMCFGMMTNGVNCHYGRLCKILH